MVGLVFNYPLTIGPKQVQKGQKLCGMLRKFFCRAPFRWYRTKTIPKISKNIEKFLWPKINPKGPKMSQMVTNYILGQESKFWAILIFSGKVY